MGAVLEDSLDPTNWESGAFGQAVNFHVSQ